jgi:ligand-binding sensor domain-containing protein
VEALPLPADLEAVLFDGGATWFASLSGVCRFQQGQLETWGEAEGLPSELVWGIARASDGTIVAATSEGLARFDGHAFRPFGGERFAVHGLATGANGVLWAATNKGLRPLEAATWTATLDDAPEMVSGNLRDVVSDGFGRVWALTTNAVAVASPAPPK